MRAWSCQRIQVADRGLREGMLSQLMNEDGYVINPQLSLC
jgi:exopolyphosphatase/pppGpp-phosphohydrolase